MLLIPNLHITVLPPEELLNISRSGVITGNLTPSYKETVKGNM